MNAVRSERHCELRERLKRFTMTYWWVEYWGDWLGPGGDQSLPGYELSPLGRAMMRGKDYIAATGERDQWNNELQQLERSLGHLKKREKDNYVVLYLHHNRKWNLHQIEMRFEESWRAIDTRLWYAYSYLEAGLDHSAPGLLKRPAPIWE